MEKLFVVDVANYLYRSYYAIRNMTNHHGQATNAIYGFARALFKLIKDFDARYLIAVCDGPESKKPRQALHPEYKSHRLKMPEDLPQQFTWAEKFCRLMGIPFLAVPEVEADDTMGAIATWAAAQGAHVYLCTSDKDMCQMVSSNISLLYTYKDNFLVGPQQVEEIYGVKPSQIIDYLSIIGDQSDNIPGLPGIGPKTASALLHQYHSLDEILKNSATLGGKKQEIFETHRKTALLSRQLVTLNTSVEFPKEPHFFEIQPPHTDALKSFFEELNFQSLLKELSGEPATPTIQGPKGAYHLVDDPESLAALMQYLSTASEIAFDTETTSTQALAADLVGVSLSCKAGEAWYLPTNGNLGLPPVISALEKLFSHPEIRFFGHNVKYDLHVLAKQGIAHIPVHFDTMLASYVLNSHNNRHGLDLLVEHYFHTTMTPIKQLIGSGKKQRTMAEVPIEEVCAYSCADADYTFRLKELFAEQLKERKLDNLYHTIEMPLLPVLMQMEQHGIFVDTHHLTEVATELNQTLAQLEQRIHTLAGEPFNLNSPKQLSQILYHKLGIPYPQKAATTLSTSADILELLQHAHPIIKDILQYRSLEKLRSTYVEVLPQEILPSTGRIHCSFNQSVAATGRLSCTDPNLQNIPVRTAEGRRIRAAFRPQKEGWCYLSADYSQIELRLLAHMSGDPVLIQAFKEGEDIHTFTASLVLNIPIDKVSENDRHQAKAVNFGIVYGQQAFGLAKQLGIPQKMAAAFIAQYFERYPKVREFLERCKIEAHQSGKAVTITGRERLIPDIDSRNANLRAAADRLAINTPLQGSAADLIKLAMLRVDKALKAHNLKGFMLLQIHDELLFELPEEEIPLLKPLVQEAMQNVWKLQVPLVVDVKVGRNWKEC